MPDPNTPVDSAGRVINIGDNVDLTGCTVVGFRADPNNRFNVWVTLKLNTIRTIDPTNPINRQKDAKAILVSGYNCVSSPPATLDSTTPAVSPDTSSTEAPSVDEQAAPAITISLPSNFLAPSIL